MFVDNLRNGSRAQLGSKLLGRACGRRLPRMLRSRAPVAQVLRAGVGAAGTAQAFASALLRFTSLDDAFSTVAEGLRELGSAARGKPRASGSPGPPPTPCATPCRRLPVPKARNITESKACVSRKPAPFNLAGIFVYSFGSRSTVGESLFIPAPDTSGI